MNAITELTGQTIGELVSKDYRKADVFKAYGIDFCCGGRSSVKEACLRKGINYEELKAALLEIENTSMKAENYDDWELDVLIDHIINKHHKYVNQSLPLLLEYATKVAHVHGEHNPENIKIAELLHELASELQCHLYKEEQILFPYVKELVNCKRTNGHMKVAAFGTVKDPINMMELEHDIAGDLMKTIRLLSFNYTPPLHACSTYMILYSKLEEFENDLHTHIHLENNILFPKADLLEKELTEM
ncbi:iron-sulfur cluster repair di-iron protein [Solitalea longa]|uniref:Iron-sulfur cluster repair di-iron protein n=1 Tax=Solitalea longa TaxID=2079460 RepID=A0A2S5A284_9SPHI|nr:iron-sulfur cluster repair di-iron protein [Solitalea longa]POY36708.1 iron-sulfur cluster repair di-iron protein [Solitalea longa]